MNTSNPPKPMDCQYKATLRQLEVGESIRTGDFFQTFLGNLTRVASIDENYTADTKRSYYRVVGLSMISDEL